MHKQPQKIESKPVKPQTPSRALMQCIPNINHIVALNHDDSHDAVSVLRITNVPIAQAIVIKVEKILT